jgi:Holliday junction resolvase RusA-like endonuclease
MSKRKDEIIKYNDFLSKDTNRKQINYRFSIDCKLAPSPRPKAMMVQGSIRVYAPKEYTFYKKELAEEIKEKMRHLGFKDILDEPLALSILFRVRMPIGFSAKEKVLALTGNLLPTTKPDLDNLEKTILDTMNAIVYTDDTCITSLSSFKMYSETEGFDLILKSCKGIEQWTL